MSIRVMTEVWDKARRYSEGSLLVLLALADWADDSGKCFPSVTQIALKSRLTDRQVYNILRGLKADGVISVLAGGGRGKRTQYQINTAKFSGFTNANPETVSAIPDVEKPKPAPAKPCNAVHKNPEMGRAAYIEPSGTVTKSKANPSPAPSRQREGDLPDDVDSRRVADAAAKVCTEVSMANPRFEKALRKAVTLYAARERMSPAEVAEAMIAAWREFQQAREWIERPWGPRRFFLDGHWANPRAWPVDYRAMARAREARVGMNN